MKGDDVIGHAAPAIQYDTKVRDALLKELKRVAPDFTYEWSQKLRAGFTMHIIRGGQSIWSWDFPSKYNGRWVLIVEEFLQIEVKRLGGTYDP